MPDDTTAPVTAEDLRAELIAQLDSEPYMTPAETVDGVMVVLDRLGVIGHANYRASSHASEHAAAAEDLRERIAEAIRAHHTDDDRVDAYGDPVYCVCGELVEDWDKHWSRAVLVVRDEELERLRAEIDRLADFGLKERERHKAEVERLREIERVTTPPADELEMPADPAELRELWEFINRQSRWQYHMAHKFGGQVGRLRAELRIANEDIKITDEQMERLRAELAEVRTGRERYAAATANWTASAIEQRKRAETAETDLAEMQAIATERSEACARAEAERDALTAAVAEAMRQIGKWMDPGDPGPLFAPGHAAEVDRTLKKYIGEHVIAALAAPETTTERTDLIAAYAVHLRSAGDRADAAEAVIARSRAALAAFDGRGVNNVDVPTPREVLDAWTASLAAPESNEDAEKGNDDA